MFKDRFDLGYIYKAQATFEDYRKGMITKRDKAGATQAFEYCYELAWKLMKRVLEDQGLKSGSPKDSFRKAFEIGLIADPEAWFDFQDARNLTVHTYNETNLNDVVESFDLFSEELKQLLDHIEKLP